MNFKAPKTRRSNAKASERERISEIEKLTWRRTMASCTMEK